MPSLGRAQLRVARSSGSHVCVGGRAAYIATAGVSITILRSGSCNCSRGSVPLHLFNSR
uniref:Uncharacterized protein n=1 Tax=Solanum lycopersicum TaxID=4081 RepID=A0A3Q7ECJ9_SOLLC